MHLLLAVPFFRSIHFHTLARACHRTNHLLRLTPDLYTSPHPSTGISAHPTHSRKAKNPIGRMMPQKKRALHAFQFTAVESGGKSSRHNLSPHLVLFLAEKTFGGKRNGTTSLRFLLLNSGGAGTVGKWWIFSSSSTVADRFPSSDDECFRCPFVAPCCCCVRAAGEREATRDSLCGG